MIWTRSSREKSGFLAGLWPIAIMSLLKWCWPRQMTSRCPLVMGSNVPGKRPIFSVLLIWESIAAPMYPVPTGSVCQDVINGPSFEKKGKIGWHFGGVNWITNNVNDMASGRQKSDCCCEPED